MRFLLDTNINREDGIVFVRKRCYFPLQKLIRIYHAKR